MGIKILGIDPGSHHLGVGFVLKTGNKLQLLHAETLHAPAKAEFFDRLRILHTALKKLVVAWQPHELAMEDVFSSKNPRSAFQLGVARGVALSTCLESDLPVYEYAPTQVKSVVTGHGRADKSQVQKMVGLILGAKVDVELLGLDASDALAVAICHAHSVRFIKAYDRIPSRKST